MTVDHAVNAWDSMLTNTFGSAAAVSRRQALRGHAIVVLRTTGLLVIAALAILVLLPAALAAQGAHAG